MKTLVVPKANLPQNKFNTEELRAEIAAAYSVTEAEIILSYQQDGTRIENINGQRNEIAIPASLTVTGPDEMTLGGLIQLMVSHNPAKDDAEQAAERGAEQLYSKLKESSSFQAEVLSKLP